MQFKHPEILYALFLLLIPIIIHLFQLRRFQKVAFTNVDFLKKATLQTRKSAVLKKWLTLLFRLLALASIILAFAQPFSASKTALTSDKETVIYIDNSWSMEAKGANGAMLKRSTQELFNNLSGDEKISWFTNNTSQKNSTQEAAKNKIIGITYSDNQLSLEEVLLQSKQFFSKKKTSYKNLIIISDFQQKGLFPLLDNTITVNYVQTTPVVKNNVSVDTAFIEGNNGTVAKLNTRISRTGDLPASVSVSLWKENRLLAKTAANFEDSENQILSFDIENPSNFKGHISIEDTHLQFDNTLYFNTNETQKIKVLSINEGNPEFLRKLFNQERFEYLQEDYNAVNYSSIPLQDFIILNELQTIPPSLQTVLQSFVTNGGSLFIIPSNKANIATYNAITNAFQLGTFSDLNTNTPKKVTTINYAHPLYNNVFEKEVSNFQYPTVNNSFEISTNAVKILTFEDGAPFVLQKGKTFLATGAFAIENSNFKNSPLIVPTLIAMAQQSLPLSKLYFEIGTTNTFAVPIKLIQDEILQIKDSLQAFIPLQQTKANQVLLTTSAEPSISGNYSVTKKDSVLQTVSYNYKRDEGILNYSNPKDWEGAQSYSSINELFETITKENEINSFWRWFVIFALLFLLVEMFILKFFK